MEKSLGNLDIVRLLNGRTKVMRYDGLSSVRSAEDLLFPFGNVVVLYPGEFDVGHWVALLRTVDCKGRDVIEFYDPYGISVDREFRIIPSKLPRFMSRLLANSHYPIEYNDYPVQRKSEQVNTCGRHVVNRIRHSHMCLEEYNDTFGTNNGRIDPDKLVVLMTKK